MITWIIRRLRCLVVAMATFVTSTNAIPFSAHALEPNVILNKLQEIEARENSLIGVAVLDTETQEKFEYRGTERFALNSTFKAFACGALLYKADLGEIDLEERYPIQETDLVPWSPVTKKHIGSHGLSLHDFCEATMIYSDNTAANFVLDALGGPSALTTFLRETGDTTTRLDRQEPEMNVVTDGEVRDTTSPNAALNSLRLLTEGDLLSDASKIQMIDWMKANVTGKNILRPHLPQGWEIGDRTGADRDRKRAVIATVFPPDRAPVYITIYMKLKDRTNIAGRDAIMSELGATLFETLQSGDE
ncbi:MAG: class A beta-lactamase [Roseibium sp.]